MRHRVSRSTGLALALLLGACSAAPSASCAEDGDCPRGAMCRMGSCFFPTGGGCTDADGDGYSEGPACPRDAPVDCDDGNPDIHPGAEEICDNGVDENCSAGADEGCPCGDVSVGATRDCGHGACAGIGTCMADGTWSECQPLVDGVPERCGPNGAGDGVDDDCDGMVDDGCEACPTRPDGTGLERVCGDDGGSAFCSSNGICL